MFMLIQDQEDMEHSSFSSYMASISKSISGDSVRVVVNSSLQE